MKVVFRTDSSSTVGTGHIKRCLALAGELRRAGVGTLFISRNHPGNINEEIVREGHKLAEIPVRTSMKDGKLYGSQWLGSSIEEDLEDTIAILKSDSFDWIIVDHYSLDASWESPLKSFCKRIFVIDDLANRPHDCDFLLDQNFGRVKGDYECLVPQSAKSFLGPNFALLRPEFKKLRGEAIKKRDAGRLEKILISMGGIDKNNATKDVLFALNDLDIPGLNKIFVVLGDNAPWIHDIKGLAASMKTPTEVLVNTNKMAQLMFEADLAIGAAGTTSWERCALGLPTLIYIIAENQRAIGEKLQLSGASKIIGDYSFGLEKGIFQDQIRTFSIDPEALKSMSMNAAKLTDGSGAALVAAELMNGVRQ